MMNSEEFDRHMNFILSQQAKFEVDIARLQETQKESAQNISESAQNISQLGQLAANHEGRLTEAEDIITRLARVTKEGFKQLAVKIDALVDGQIRTEEVLQEFIRRTGNGRNN